MALVLVACGAGEDSRLALERNKALIRRAHDEVWSRGDLGAADQIYAKDFIAHWMGGYDTKGLPDFKAFVAKARTRAPDLKETIHQVVAEQDLVVTRFMSRGTFASDPGEPSKSKEVTMQEIAIHRIQAGKIVEQWTVGAPPDIRHLDLPAKAAGPPTPSER